MASTTTTTIYRPRDRGFLLALPAIFWLVVFFMLPLAIVLGVSFLTRGQGGQGVLPLTFENYERVFGVFSPILWRSLWIAFATMVICLLVGYPLAFFVSTRKSALGRQLTLFLVILPFWTNFLVRTYAWQVLLGQDGTINGFLRGIGMTSEPLQLLNTEFAVLLGLVYGFLPFMVLPIYASIERFDFKFVDAAHDLGANDWWAFWKVVLPMTAPGVLAGCVLVFIPAVGSFVTPDLLGGTRGLMIGNLIQRQFRGTGNMPLGSAMSIVMMSLVMLSLLVYVRFGTSGAPASVDEGRFKRLIRQVIPDAAGQAWSAIRHTATTLTVQINFWVIVGGALMVLFPFTGITANFPAATVLMAAGVVAIIGGGAGLIAKREPLATVLSLLAGMLGLVPFIIFFVAAGEDQLPVMDAVQRFDPLLWVLALVALMLVLRGVLPKQGLRRDRFVRRSGKLGLILNPVFSYFFLWVPILVLVVFSFNASRSVARWQGFTLQWYDHIFNGVVGAEGAAFSTSIMLNSLKNSLVVSTTATVISTIIGTMVALSMARSKFRGKNLVDGLLFLPVVIPEITQGVSLLVFFNIVFQFWGQLTGQSISLGFHTVIIAHVAFDVSYVAIVVRARLADMNPRLEEAARDLGANEWRTFWRITFPLILPGIVAGALLAFTISLDDFVVTFFTSGVGTTTLPVFVYGLLKLTVTPEINAISTLMLIASTVLVGISLAMQGRNAATRI